MAPKSTLFVVALYLLAAPLALGQTLRPAAPEAAAPVNGFPSWEERVLHQWINRARVAPAVDLAGCGANCSAEEMAPSCYTPVPPLMWRHETAVAARFHSASMARQGFFDHSTPCTLRSNLADLYPATCDGSENCSCSSPDGATSAGPRVGLFGSPYSGEIIAVSLICNIIVFVLVSLYTRSSEEESMPFASATRRSPRSTSYGKRSTPGTPC